MAPKKKLDKGKASMIEEEPRRPRTRSRGTTLVISEPVDRLVPRPKEAQTVTLEAASIMPAEDIRESGRIEISDRREVSRTTNVSGHDDRMYAMLERMANTMDQRYSDIRNLACVVEREEEEQNKQRERGKGSNPYAKKQRLSTGGTTPTPKGACYHCGQWGHRKIECPQLMGQLVGQIAEQARGQMSAQGRGQPQQEPEQRQGPAN
ncbi:hypothetical protein ACLOJK_036501, partial [Asimina triloba]